MTREDRAGEPEITAGLVRVLLADQHPELARLPIGEQTVPAGGGMVRGWDNTMVRLGKDLAVRLPRHDAGQHLLDREVAWLGRIAEQTGLQLPVTVARGQPSAGYPYRWAVVRWEHGTPAAYRPAGDRDRYAAGLADLLRRLHVPAPQHAPASRHRGVPLAGVAERFATRWQALRPRCTVEQAAAVETGWQDALAAPRYPGPPLWLHGDPHPDNTVVAGLGSSPQPVLVDFGDLCAGDPASDLGIALTHFTPAGRQAFRARYEAGRTVDEGLWRRARGWSIAVSTLMALQPPHDVLHDVGRQFLRHAEA